MATGVTTEWEDIHVKKGNWKARENVAATGEEVFQHQQTAVEDYNNWHGMDKKQVDEMVEDDLDLEDDDYLKEYQAARIAEMKGEAQKYKFNGMVYEINKAEYEWHVNNMPEGTLGVIHLY
jgi:hypothetical protein